MQDFCHKDTKMKDNMGWLVVHLPELHYWFISNAVSPDWANRLDPLEIFWNWQTSLLCIVVKLTG